MEKKRIYISIPITGNVQVMKQSENCEKKLKVLFPDIFVFNPYTTVKNSKRFKDMMENEKFIEVIDLLIKGKFTHMVFCKGFQNSKGCMAEYYIAQKLGLELLFNIDV